MEHSKALRGNTLKKDCAQENNECDEMVPQRENI
jgi:hypothetical protein